MNRSAAWLLRKLMMAFRRMVFKLSGTSETEFFKKNSCRDALLHNFCKKIHLIFHLRGSEFDSDLKHSDKEYIYLTIDILHMIYCVVKVIYK